MELLKFKKTQKKIKIIQNLQLYYKNHLNF